MYNDGPGGTNIDCKHGNEPGCYGHRKNILGNYGKKPVMGAAKKGSSYTEVFEAK
jgi:hypothetical protein